MLFLGCPSLYCNVSDSWMFAEKWKRIFVAAAGICVELVLAALATVGWRLSSPGVFHNACLSVMTVCSVNTLLFNGNPLMRYDGYFMLADFMEIPNLAEVSRRRVRERLVGFFLGNSFDGTHASRDRPTSFLLWYGVLSALYRWTVVVSIYLFLLNLSRNCYAESLVRIGGGVYLTIYLASRFQDCRSFLGPADPLHASIGRRMRPSTMMLMFILLVAAFIPFPKSVIGRAVLQTRNAEQVIVQTSGILYEILPTGGRVEAGDVLARLADDKLALEVIELRGDVSHCRAQLRNAERQAIVENHASLKCVELKESLTSLERQLDAKETQLGNLTISAKHGGVVVSPPEKSTTSSPANSLRNWQGIPQESRNVGCTLETGTLLCEIINPAEWDVVISVDEAEARLLIQGQAVEILWDQFPLCIFNGRVVEIALQANVELPELSKATSSVADGIDTQRAREASYQVRIATTDGHAQLRRGLTGTAKIRVQAQSTASRFAGWFYETFYELL